MEMTPQRFTPDTPVAPDPKQLILFPGSPAAIRKLIGATRVAPTINCTEDENRVRPEYADDLNIDVLMRRYGQMLPVAAQQEHGTYDYDLDLNDFHEAAQQANDAWNRLPASIRDRYHNIPAFLDALERGEVRQDKRSAKRSSNTRTGDVKPPETPAKTGPDKPDPAKTDKT